MEGGTSLMVDVSGSVMMNLIPVIISKYKFENKNKIYLVSPLLCYQHTKESDIQGSWNLQNIFPIYLFKYNSLQNMVIF